MTRWGRSTTDLFQPLHELHAWNVSLIAVNATKADRLTPKELRLVEEGRSYLDIAKEVKLSKNTVMSIVHRNRMALRQAVTI